LKEKEMKIIGNCPRFSVRFSPRILCLASLVCGCILSAQAQTANVVNSDDEFDLNCFTVIVGREASADGSVFIAHNEDNNGDPIVDWHKVPRIKHPAGQKRALLSGEFIEEPQEAWGYLWITVSKYNGEQYINEWGVAITSDASRSKETNGNGKITPSLRRDVIERARTAREAVQIAGALIEKYGYSDSGRVYSIADPNEAWVLEVVNGKHWIAKRVPDDEVVAIPNYYVIDTVDLKDTANYLSSPDIIDYAIAKGWYDPASGQPFNFRRAYCRPDKLEGVHNIARRWMAMVILSEKYYKFYDEFPFSFKPKKKIGLADIMQVLGNHYEGTEFEMHPAYNNGCPHSSTTTMRICSKQNNFGSIIQLRKWLPVDIGAIMWVAPKYPCIQPYIPWYYGVTKISPFYEKEDYRAAIANYLVKDKDYRSLYPNHAYWTFVDFALKIDSCYGKQAAGVKQWKQAFEEDIFKAVQPQEKKIIEEYKTNPANAQKMLTDLTNGFAEKALSDTKKKLSELK
jgi:dipeptidase